MKLSIAHKWKVICGIVMLLGVAGIIQFVRSNPGTPPDAHIHIDKIRFQAVQGSYCWSAWGKGTCADMVSVDELIQRYQTQIPTVQSGNSVRVSFGVQPEELSVTAHFPAQERPDESIPVTNGTFTVTRGAGIQYYILHGRWSSGSSSYVFALDVSGEASPSLYSTELIASDLIPKFDGG